MTDVPAAVISALANRRAERTSEKQGMARTANVSVGDLRVIEALSHRPADQRIGLVLRIDSTNEFAEVLLVHSAPELATTRDVVVETDVAPVPYKVVVQTELRGVVWILQLGRRVGHFDEQVFTAVKSVGNTTAVRDLSEVAASEVSGIYSGSRLAGPLDRRWSFKESEGAALRNLTADCTEALLDHGLVWQMDARLLLPDLLDLAHDPEQFLNELIHWVSTRSLAVADDDLEMLLSVGALQPESWAQVSDLGSDILMSLQDVLLRVATGVGTGAAAELPCLLAPAHLERVDHSDRIDRVHYLGAREPVMT
jgi:hypothetical protein